MGPLEGIRVLDLSMAHTDEILGEFGFGAGGICELRAQRIVN
jgi:hypothetical protein